MVLRQRAEVGTVRPIPAALFHVEHWEHLHLRFFKSSFTHENESTQRVGKRFGLFPPPSLQGKLADYRCIFTAYPKGYSFCSKHGRGSPIQKRLKVSNGSGTDYVHVSYFLMKLFVAA